MRERAVRAPDGEWRSVSGVGTVSTADDEAEDVREEHTGSRRRRGWPSRPLSNNSGYASGATTAVQNATHCTGRTARVCTSSALLGTSSVGDPKGDALDM